MENLQLLWEFTHKLSAPESKEVQRSFELRGPKAAQSDPAKLFRALQKVSTYSEEIIHTQWKLQFKQKVKPARAFHDAKYILKNILLDSLVKANRQFVGGEAERLLNHAELFISKAYYTEALHTLQLALVETNRCIVPYYKNMILQRMLFLQQFTGGKIMDENRAKLLKLCTEAINELEIFNAVFQYNHRLSNILKRTSIVKTEPDNEEMESLLSDKVLQFNKSKLCYAAQLYLAKSKSWLYGLSFELEKQYEAQKELCALMKVNAEEHLKTSVAPVYLTEFCDAALFSAQLIQIEVSTAYADYVLENAHHAGVHSTLFNMYPLVLKMLANYCGGDEKEMEKYLRQVDVPLYKSLAHFPPNAVDNIRMNMMKGWLKIKDYEKVKQWHYTSAEKKPFIRLDSYFVSQLIYLCALYEQCPLNNNKTIISVSEGFIKHAKTIGNMKAASKKNMPVESAIIQTFFLLSDSQNAREHRTYLESLQKKLSRSFTKAHTYQNRLYVMFDFKGWIKQQIERLQ